VGGTLGTVAAGLFASLAINSAGANGMFFGNPRQLAVQAGAVALIALYSFVVSLILFKIIEKVVGVRVDVEQETEGIDITQHGETGYTT